MSFGRFEPVEVSHLAEIAERLLGFLGVDRADRKADVDEHVIADFRLRHAGEAHLLDDSAEADATGAQEGIVACDIEDLSGNG